ncbi:MAG: RHS repeat-associated core domain-containing protein [Acidobacteriota bacterium]|nr:MAG: RHS repeat-associated core domain-containing protein [Acidobacteriota bacterium]
MTAFFGRQFTFNGDNKQVEVRNSANQVVGEYKYDGLGKRIKKETATEYVVLVYDGLGKLIGEYSADGPPAAPTVNYTATDPLGSPRVLTNKQGEVVSRRDFMPFGEEIVAMAETHRTPGDKYGLGDGVRQKFTGYERDAETDLNFAQARYQVASLGRFSSPDPLILSARLAFPQTWNRYIYVLNNPCSQFDPEGLYPSPAFNCSETVTSCLNDEQRRILTESKVKVGKETLSGEALYNALTEKQQNAFVNVTDKLASYSTNDGKSLLASVKAVTEFRNDRIFATVDKNIGSNLNESSEFSRANASQHAPFDSSSFKSNDSTLGNIQISLNSSGTGADIDIDIGNVKSGDIAGPVIHFFEVVRNKLFKKQTGQDTVRRILIADPKVQTVTPSSDPKFNRRPR